MHTKLQLLFDDLETSRECVLEQVSALSEERFFRQAEPGRWSIAQILTHLLTSERLSLQYMRKKSLGMETLSNSGVFEDLKLALLKLSQRLPLKYKAPKIVVERTPSALPITELSESWRASRQELKNFLQSIEDKNVRKKIYKHPFAGRLNVSQALQFFLEHVHHHQPQIERLMK